jgi:hypothetical protein
MSTILTTFDMLLATVRFHSPQSNFSVNNSNANHYFPLKRISKLLANSAHHSGAGTFTSSTITPNRAFPTKIIARPLRRPQLDAPHPQLLSTHLTQVTSMQAKHCQRSLERRPAQLEEKDRCIEQWRALSPDVTSSKTRRVSSSLTPYG